MTEVGGMQIHLQEGIIRNTPFSGRRFMCLIGKQSTSKLSGGGGERKTKLKNGKEREGEERNTEIEQ